MAIVAPLSRFKKTNYLLSLVIIILVSGWFYYDANYNQEFIKKHTQEDGSADSTLKFNQIAPPYGVVLGVLIIVRFLSIKGKKVVAAEKVLISGKQTISYDSIEKIDKTFFDKKGYFTIFYKNDSGGESKITFTDRTYDNLGAVLDEIVRQIT